MIYLLAFLMATAPVDCDELYVQLQEAVQQDLITDAQANKIHRHCFTINK